MSIKKEQEVLSRMLEVADSYAREGANERARRALVCAAAKMLQIAESASITARPIMEKRAYDIIQESVHISDNMFDELLVDLEEDNLGQDVEFEDDIFNPLPRDKRVRFSEVIGLDDVKDVINRQIIYPRRYASIYNRYRKKSGGGILLYGLPGTGKTMIAKAMANEIHAKFIPIKCSDILDKYFGESERKLKELFEEAKKNRLSIIFFDEFEALAHQRGDNNSAMNQLVPELLAEMQGFEENNNVIVVCATNRPWDIDSAFMRPGRLTNRIYVPLPDRAQREKMFETKLRKVPVEDIDYAKLATLTEGYSGADIEELCDYAKNFAIDREIAEDTESNLREEDILKAMIRVKSSIHKEDIEEMRMYESGFYHAQENEQMSSTLRDTMMA